MADDPRVFVLDGPPHPDGPRWEARALSWELVNRFLEGMALIDPGYDAEVRLAREVVPGIPATPAEQAAFVRELGEVLFALLPDEVARALSAPGERVRLVVVERDDAGLPWEYLWAPGDALPLLLRGHVDLIRWSAAGHPQQPHREEAPALCVFPVAVQPEAGGGALFHSVDLERDLRPILQSLSPASRLEPVVRPRADSEDGLDLDQLGHLLEGCPASVLHLAAHGAGPRILLCEADGSPRGVTGASLGGLLRERGLQLVVLSACGGAGTFAHRGAAAKLAADLGEAAGVPWLLASRVSLSSRVVRAFFPPFYRALALHGDVEEATRAGRRALFDAGIWCFGGLVLFGASPDLPRRAFDPGRRGRSSHHPDDLDRGNQHALLRSTIERVPLWAWLVLAGVGVAVGATLGWREVERRQVLSVAATRLGNLDPQLDAWVAAGSGDRAWSALEDLESDLRSSGAGDLSSEAWRRHHDRLQGRDEAGQGFEALVRSYQAAQSEHLRASALARIGLALLERWRWDSAAVVFSELVRQYPEHRGIPDVIELGARLSLLAWDTDQASEALTQLGEQRPQDDLAAWGPRVAALRPAMSLGLADRELVGALDLRGDGHPELAFAGDGRLDLLSFEAGVATRRQIDLPALPGDLHFQVVRAVEGGADLLVMHDYDQRTRRGRVRLLTPTEGSFQDVSETWLGDASTGGVLVDLDHDGQLEIYLGEGPPGRRLLRLDQRDDGLWAVSREQALASRSVARSDVNDLKLADLDRDGQPELLLAAAAWQAFELRAVGAVPGSQALRTEWRRKLGQVRNLALFESDPPIVAAGKEQIFPSLVALGPDRPWGEKAGIYYFQQGAAAITRVSAQEAPAPPGDDGYLFVQRLQATDLDGDGEQEALAVLSSWSILGDISWFAPGPAAGRGGGFVTRAFQSHLAADLDGNPGTELVVRAGPAGPYWVLGMGDERFPSRQVRAGSQTQGVRQAQKSLDPRWRAVETLASASMFRFAAEACERIAASPITPEDQRIARKRAAELYALDEDWSAAAQAYRGLLAELQADPHAATAPEIAQGAIDAFVRVGAYEESWQVQQALVASSPAVENDRSSLLRALALDVQTASFDFKLDPAPAWHFPDPLAVTRRPDGLEIGLSGVDQVTSAWLPFYWGGRALRLSADLNIESVEWSSGMDIALLPEGVRAGPHIARFSFHAGGGGGVTQLGIGCDTREASSRPEAGVMWDMGGAAVERRLHVEVTVIPELGLGRCSFHSEDGAIAYEGSFEPPAAPGAGRYDLILWTSPRSHYGGHVTSVVLEELELSGLDVNVLETPEVSPGERATRQWLAGRPDEAAATLDVPGSGSLTRLQRAVALSEAGRLDAASAVIRDLLREDARTIGALSASSWGRLDCPGAGQRRLADLVRLDRDRHGPMVQQAIGPEAWLWVLYRDASTHEDPNQADHEAARRAADDALAELGRVGSGIASSARDALEAGLRLVRGRALLALDRPAAALRDLSAASEIARRHCDGGVPSLDPDRLAPGSPAWFLEEAIQSEIGLTHLEASLGRQPEALGHARQAVALAQGEDWVVDSLLVAPQVRTWVGERTDWAELLGGVEWVGEDPDAGGQAG